MVKRDKQARSAVNPENKKVKNATPVEADGIHFRSKLELYCYNILKSHQILSEYEQKTFTLLDSFEYQGEKIRPMTYKPDFTGDKWVIECKGMANDSFPLRWKLFKYYLYKNNLKWKLYLVHNRKEVQEAIKDIQDEILLRG